MAIDLYQILVGVGRLYVAPLSTAFPAVNVTPGASWTDLGETKGGVTITVDQTVAEFSTDQRTGPIKAIRTEESLLVETKMAQATLENMAQVMGTTVTDTPPGAGTIGTRKVGMTRGVNVAEYAFLFRGDSPYGDFPAQYEVPRGYFGGAQAFEHSKENSTDIPCEFHALCDLTAANEFEQFGRLVAQDAAAL